MQKPYKSLRPVRWPQRPDIIFCSENPPPNRRHAFRDVKYARRTFAELWYARQTFSGTAVRLPPRAYTVLLKVRHAGLKDFEILLAIDIYGHGIAPALRMGHLSEHTAVRACDALNGVVGTVDIRFLVV